VPLSLKEAIATISAPGQPFEIIESESHGVTNRVFKNAPATVRDFFATSRGLETTFLVYEDEEWTFDEVMREVDALGYALVHHYGVKVGDRVGIAMRNLPEWVISFAAILSVGAISVSLNAWWTEDELDYAINDSDLVCCSWPTRSESTARAGGLPARGRSNTGRAPRRTPARGPRRRVVE
jgi:long-chain acyl-CoA synthetase